MSGYDDKTCRTCGKTNFCTEQGKMALYGFMVDCPMWEKREYRIKSSDNSATALPLLAGEEPKT